MLALGTLADCTVQRFVNSLPGKPHPVSYQLNYVIFHLQWQLVAHLAIFHPWVKETKKHNFYPILCPWRVKVARRLCCSVLATLLEHDTPIQNKQYFYYRALKLTKL